MKTRQNNIAQRLAAVLLQPVHHPFNFFILLFAVSLAITHWTEIKLQQEFWLEWSTCLTANLLAISITNLLNRRLIPQIIKIRNIRSGSTATPGSDAARITHPSGHPNPGRRERFHWNHPAALRSTTLASPATGADS